MSVKEEPAFSAIVDPEVVSVTVGAVVSSSIISVCPLT